MANTTPYVFRKLTAVFLLLLVFTFSCSPDKKQKENTSRTTASPEKNKVAPVATNNINQVNVYLEVSGSMKGFMPTNKANGITGFQKIIDPFLATIQQSNTIQRKSYFEVREKPYAIDYEKLAQTVRYGIQQSASSTTIPAILDSVISKNPDGVNILISDFIYSPENGRAVSFVGTDIYRVLSKARQQGQAISVFASTSDFDGTFYPAIKTGRRTVEKCCETPVPYYVWVIGKPEMVSLFNREVVRNAFAEEAHAGFSFEAPAYSVLDKYLPVGSWYCASRSGNCQEVAISDLGSPAEMVVGINLGNLPAAFASETYLKQNLKVEAPNTDIKVTNIYPAAQFRTLKGVAEKNTDPLKPYTHFVRIKLTKLNAPQTEVHFTLANQRPAWVQQWTTTDDSQINQEGAKTFNLSGIMDGVERAFGTGANANIFDVVVTLRKEK
ncbi:hypothetical protein [Adhaeribacter aquaticus]|uniref:hypothetical protein n=1 Tax=Adhaeribacter aquaticus TaxID=299567 RepID=UPI000416BD7F|nr:hypothetical protein [Adhaeribacter aquaticus]